MLARMNGEGARRATAGTSACGGGAAAAGKEAAGAATCCVGGALTAVVCGLEKRCTRATSGQGSTSSACGHKACSTVQRTFMARQCNERERSMEACQPLPPGIGVQINIRL